MDQNVERVSLPKEVNKLILISQYYKKNMQRVVPKQAVYVPILGSESVKSIQYVETIITIKGYNFKIVSSIIQSQILLV